MEKIKYSRRILIGVAAFIFVFSGCNFSATPYPASTVIREVKFDWSTHRRSAQGSDNFQLTWADDDNLYGAWGDGGGFGGTNSDGRVSLGVACVKGPADNYTGYNIWGGKDADRPAQFTGKSWGMISIEDVLYMWVVPHFSKKGSQLTWHYSETRLAKSTDHGRSWRKADWSFNQHEKVVIPTICNFGRNYDGARDSYVYHYFIHPQDNIPEQSNDESLIVHKPGKIYLARVHKDEIFETRKSYHFFTGFDSNCKPTWGAISSKQPIFEDKNGVGWCLSVSYNPGLGRYILCTEHTQSKKGNLGIFDAPEPWGPWTTVKYCSDWGRGHIVVNTFFWNFPTKWLSNNCRDFTFVFTGAGAGLNNDSFNTIRGFFVVNEKLFNQARSRRQPNSDF